MGRIDVVIVFAKHPVSVRNQVAHISRLGRLALALGYGPFQSLHHVMMQRADQQTNAGFTSIAVGILRQIADGPAGTILSQNELESLPRISALVKSDLDDPIDTFLGFDALNGRSHGRRLANGSKVGPGVRDVTISQEEFSHFTRGFDKPTFICGACLWR